MVTGAPPERQGGGLHWLGPSAGPVYIASRTLSFLRDVRKLPDDTIREQVRSAILSVETASDLRSVPSVTKLSGAGPYFRIRTGDYRIGLRVEENVATFVRVLPRKDVYRYFP